MKKFFKRVTSFILSFAFTFLMVGDLSLDLNADRSGFNDGSMHVIINHWHADGSLSDIDLTFDNSGNIKVDKGAVADGGIIPSDSGTTLSGATVTIPTYPVGDETFSGVAISSGYDATNVTSAGDSTTVTVSYKENIPLVKVHIFYSPVNQPVAGEKFETGGSFGSATSAEIDAVTKAVAEDLGITDWNTTFDTLPSEVANKYKVYDTSQGLHTDKTAYPVDESNGLANSSNEKIDNATSTRTFEINLEAWYADVDKANIGLILDASGSMAFISDGLEPINIEYLKNNGFTVTESGGTYNITNPASGEVNIGKNQYITQDDLNKILDNQLTDNSRLGYGDYKYYIYDKRTSVSEFLPLAYWDGSKITASSSSGVEQLDTSKIPAANELLGYWKFEKNLNNEYKDASASSEIVSKGTTSDGNISYSKSATGSASYSTDKNSDKNAITIDKNAISLGVKPTGNQFTISFAVKRGGDISDGNIMFIGNINDTGTKTGKSTSTAAEKINGYLLYRDTNHLRIVNNQIPAIGSGASADLTIQNVFRDTRVDAQDEKPTGEKTKNPYTVEYNFITLVFDNGHLTEYVNGDLYGDNSDDKDSKRQNYKFTETSGQKGNGYGKGADFDTFSSFDDLGIVIGAFNEKTTDILIDDLYLFDTALNSSDVEKLYEHQGEKIYTTKKPVLAAANGQIIAEFDSKLTDIDSKNLDGWYYVNSTSNWAANFTNEDIQTGKSLKPLYATAVIENVINYSDLPEATQKLINTQDVEDGNTAGKYIYAGSENFYGNTDSDKGYILEKSGDSITAKHLEVTKDNCLFEDVTVRDGGDNKGWYSPCVFFIDNAGYLRCFYSSGTSEKADDFVAGVSYVYVKPDNTNIKAEALQYAVGEFAAALHEDSPESYLSAVRFSTRKAITESKKTEGDLDKLVMLDWTKDAYEASKIMNIKRGSGGTVAGDISELNKITQYNYGMTGGTDLYSGLKAFNEQLKGIMPKGEGEAKKYLVVFTDGKDDSINDGDSDRAIDLANELKGEGYTIFCVLLATGSLNKEDSGVQKFIGKIAGTSTSGDDYPTLVNDDYIFVADNEQELAEIFTEGVLGSISDSLRDYTVQDYIDPRFDLIVKGATDNNDYKLVLDTDGKVNILNSALTPVTDEKLIYRYTGEVKAEPKADVKLSAPYSFKGYIRLYDGTETALYYDTDKKMYFLHWDNATIPACSVGDKSITVWSKTMRLTAKDDFIGGNAVLTNGNAADMNYVYSVKATNKDSGTTYAQASDYVSKGFPRTTVNVRIPELDVKGDREVIYLGETIDPVEIAEKIGKTVEGNIYWEYLARYYAHITPGVDYTNANKDEILAKAIQELLVNGTESTTNGEYSKTLEYIYLPGMDNSSISKDINKNYFDDKLGKITYSIQTITPESGEKTETDKTSFITKNTKERTYELSVTYTAYDNGTKNYKDRNDDLVDDTEYKWDRNYKPEVGKEQTIAYDSDKHTVNIVKGEIVLGVQFDNETYTYLHDNFADEPVKYDVTLKRTYSGYGDEKIGEVTDQKVGKFNVSIDASTDWDSLTKTSAIAADPIIKYDGTTVTYYFHLEDIDSDFEFKNEYLPIGDYTVEYTAPDCLDFGNIEAVEVTDTMGDLFTTFESGKTKTTKDHLDSETEGSATPKQIAAPNEKAKIQLGTTEYTEPAKYYTDDRLALMLIAPKLNGGKLTVSKTVNDNEDNINKDYPYTFTVKIYNEDSLGSEVLYNGAVTATRYSGRSDTTGASVTGKFIDGKFTFELKHGESIEFTNLPVGTKFTVTEKDAEIYKAKYTFGKVTNEEYPKDGITGEITAETKEPSVEIINTPIKGELAITKTVLDKDDVAIAADNYASKIPFTFNITLTDDDNKPVSGKFNYTINGSTDIYEIEFNNDGEGTLELKNGQTAVITGIPFGTKFTVSEAENAGYDTTVTGYTVENKTASGTIPKDSVTVKFSNKQKTADMSISKVVKNSDGSDLTPEILADEFGFEVDLSIEANGSKIPVSGEFDAVYSENANAPSKRPTNIKFMNGNAEFTLYHGDKLTIKGLPVGASYTITETDSKGLVPRSKDITGTISETAANSVEFINQDKVAEISITKQIKSYDGITIIDPANNAEFTFTAVFKKSRTDTDTLKDTFYITKDGGISHEEISSGGKFTLKNGQTALITGLPDGTYYEITETVESGAKYLPENYDVNKGIVASGTASASTPAAPVEIIVTNVEQMKLSDLIVTKSVTDAGDKDAEFDFTVTIGRAGTFSYAVCDIGTDPATITSWSEASSGTGETSTTFSAKLKDGQQLVVKDIPAGTFYSITETAEEFDTAVAINGVPVAASGSVTDVKTVQGNIPADGTSVTAAYTNTRKTVLGSLKITKTVVNDYGDVDTSKQFEIEVVLTAPDGKTIDTSGMESLGSVNVASDGKVTLDVLLRSGESVTINGLPIGTQFTVSETVESSDGYDVSYSAGGAITGMGSITQDDPNAAITVTNTAKQPITPTDPPKDNGSLTVSKTAVYENGDPFEASEKYSFTVVLGDTSVNGQYGDMNFTNGTATFELESGKSVTASGLPAGTTFTVTESSTGDFKTSAVLTGTTDTDSEDNSVSGTLPEDSAVTAAFTNTYSDPVPKTAGLTVSKTAVYESGDPFEASEKYSFTVVLGDTSVTGTYGEMNFTNGTATFELGSGESKTASGLPAGITFTVTESSTGDFKTSAVLTGTTDTDTENDSVSGTLPEDSAVTAAFTNTYSDPVPKTAGLTVSKTAVYENGEPFGSSEKYSFSVVLSDTSVTGTYGEMNFTNGAATFELGSGESVTASGLPAGITFTVTEYSTGDFKTSVVLTGATDTDSEDNSVSGTLPEDSAVTAAFTNTYSVPANTEPSEPSDPNGGGGTGEPENHDPLYPPKENVFPFDYGKKTEDKEEYPPEDISSSAGINEESDPVGNGGKVFAAVMIPIIAAAAAVIRRRSRKG